MMSLASTTERAVVEDNLAEGRHVMISKNRLVTLRGNAIGSGHLEERGVGRPSDGSGPDDLTSTPRSLREEAIDYCLQCAHYTIDPEKPDQCIRWDTCEERQERFPLVS